MSLHITELAKDSLDNVTESNEQLRQAQEYQKGSTGWLTLLFSVLTVLLWLWEWLNQSYV